MKKLFYLIPVALLTCTGTLYAQFGIQAGPGIASCNQKMTVEGIFSDDIDWENRVGVYAGFFYRKQLGKIALQPELNFIQKGGTNDMFDENMKLFVNYMEIPLYVLYNGGNKTGFYGGLGPSFNYGLAGNFVMGAEEEGVKFGSDKDISRSHLSINGIAGYQFPNGLGINAFLSQSLTKSPAEQNAEIPEFPAIKVKTEYSFLNWGIRFSYWLGRSTKSK